MGSAPDPLVGQSTAHAHTFFSKEWKVLQLNFSQGLNIQGKTIESQPAGTEKKRLPRLHKVLRVLRKSFEFGGPMDFPRPGDAMLWWSVLGSTWP